MSTVTSADSVFEEWLGSIPKAAPGSHATEVYPFDVRVGVVKMAPPRHERFEFMLDIGRGDISRIFEGRRFRSPNLTFMLPERHMSVQEQHAMMNVLKHHPHIEDIKTVDVITSSAIMISNFFSEQMVILTWEDDHKYNGDA